MRTGTPRETHRRKIHSGSFSYLCRLSQDYAKQGYKVVKTRKHPDGKETWVFEFNDNTAGTK